MQSLRSALMMLSLTLLLLANGCGGGDDSAIRFRYWGDLAENKIIEQAIKDFSAANPGIKVKLERKSPDATYANILMTEFAAEKAPDVIFIGDLNCDTLIRAGRFMELDSFLEKDPELKKTDYYPLMIQRLSHDGKLYVLPRDIAPVNCVYYNKKLFDEAKLPYPKDNWTWKDLRAMAIKMTHRDAKGIGTQFGYGEDNTNLDPYIYSSGGTMVDNVNEPKRITMDSEKALRGLKFRMELYHTLKVMPITADTSIGGLGGGQSLFMTGKLAMFFTGIWKTPSFREIKDFDWDIAPFPAGPDGNRQCYVAGGGYGINVNTKHRDAAWALVRHMAGEPGQRLLASTGLAQPALMRLANSPVFLDGKKPLNKKMLLKSANLGYTSPAVAWWTEYLEGTFRPKTDPIWVSGYKGDAVAEYKKAVAEGNKRFLKVE